jgi:hypothetical protein
MREFELGPVRGAFRYEMRWAYSSKPKLEAKAEENKHKKHSRDNSMAMRVSLVCNTNDRQLGTSLSMQLIP